MELATGKERTIDGFAEGGRIVLGHPKTREAMRAGLAMYFETLDDPELMEIAREDRRRARARPLLQHPARRRPRDRDQPADLDDRLPGGPEPPVPRGQARARRDLGRGARRAARARIRPTRRALRYFDQVEWDEVSDEPNSPTAARARSTPLDVSRTDNTDPAGTSQPSRCRPLSRVRRSRRSGRPPRSPLPGQHGVDRLDERAVPAQEGRGRAPRPVQAEATPALRGRRRPRRPATISSAARSSCSARSPSSSPPPTSSTSTSGSPSFPSGSSSRSWTCTARSRSSTTSGQTSAGRRRGARVREARVGEIVGSYDAIRWVPEAHVVRQRRSTSSKYQPVSPPRHSPSVSSMPRRAAEEGHGVDRGRLCAAPGRAGRRREHAPRRGRRALQAGGHRRRPAERRLVRRVRPRVHGAGQAGADLPARGSGRRTEEAFGVELPLVPTSKETLADDLRTLIDHPELRDEIGQRSRAYVERVHDANVIADRLIAIYESL